MGGRVERWETVGGERKCGKRRGIVEWGEERKGRGEGGRKGERGELEGRVARREG